MKKKKKSEFQSFYKGGFELKSTPFVVPRVSRWIRICFLNLIKLKTNFLWNILYWTLAIVKIYKIMDPWRTDTEMAIISGQQHLQWRCWMVLARCYPTVWNLRHWERAKWLHPELGYRQNAKEENRCSVRLFFWWETWHAEGRTEESTAEWPEERTKEEGNKAGERLESVDVSLISCFLKEIQRNDLAATAATAA